MIVAESQGGVPIRLTEERWRHITERHPELATERERVMETLSEPDLVQGDRGELLASRFYARTPVRTKHLVVAYRERDASDRFSP